MRLSVITVCFNAENVIRKTIESVLNQSEDIYEYIFVDGKSKDNTVAIIESYRKVFEKREIKFVVKSEPDEGISDAFNKGISLSTGDYIGILNADDEFNPNCVQILKEYISKNDADVYYGDCIWRDKNKDIYKRPKHDLRKLLYNMILYHPAVFVKKSCYYDCGNFDLSYRFCMDKHFLYRCFIAGKKFYYIKAPLVIFKAGEGTRMAIEFGEPKMKAETIELCKRLKHIVVIIAKKTKLYLLIKGAI